MTLTDSAELCLQELYLSLAACAPHQGVAWFNGLERAILSLDQFPRRCPRAAESGDVGHEVRVLNHGRAPHVYRIFFLVDDDAAVVQVIQVRHGARRPIDRGGLLS